MPLSAQYCIGQRQEGDYRDPIEYTMKREGPDSRESEEGDRTRASALSKETTRTATNSRNAANGDWFSCTAPSNLDGCQTLRGPLQASTPSRGQELGAKSAQGRSLPALARRHRRLHLRPIRRHGVRRHGVASAPFYGEIQRMIVETCAGFRRSGERRYTTLAARPGRPSSICTRMWTAARVSSASTTPRQCSKSVAAKLHEQRRRSDRRLVCADLNEGVRSITPRSSCWC